MQNNLSKTLKKRNAFGVFFWGWLTSGIYTLYWLVQTKNNINRLGGNIPTAWWVLVPFAYFWWAWRYTESLHKVTKGDMGKAFIYIMLLINGLGSAILQSRYNDYS